MNNSETCQPCYPNNYRFKTEPKHKQEEGHAEIGIYLKPKDGEIQGYGLQAKNDWLIPTLFLLLTLLVCSIFKSKPKTEVWKNTKANSLPPPKAINTGGFLMQNFGVRYSEEPDKKTCRPCK